MIFKTVQNIDNNYAIQLAKIFLVSWHTKFIFILDNNSLNLSNNKLSMKFAWMNALTSVFFFHKIYPL
ncbi:hypothetical protein DDF86_06330 [Acinetobacter junii]|nr:hypothetical protein DDF86_06330 [Acinetobacter junii]RBA41970.1 hypothetical protein DDG62_04620 [Acinetobacter junii]